jgi:hypothetical protein
VEGSVSIASHPDAVRVIDAADEEDDDGCAEDTATDDIALEEATLERVAAGAEAWPEEAAVWAEEAAEACREERADDPALERAMEDARADEAATGLEAATDEEAPAACPDMPVAGAALEDAACG